jgi:hypothetical protein
MSSTLSEDSERLRRSFWKRKLQAFYILFNDVGPAVETVEGRNVSPVGTPPPRRGEQWMRHEASVEDALNHFEPFYGDMWEHLQGMLGARLPPITEDGAALVREATRLLNADYPEEKCVDAVVAAVEHCRRQGALRGHAVGEGDLTDDRLRQERQELARTLRQVPSWARGALMGVGSTQQQEPVLLSSVVLLRSLFRRKLEAYYTLVDDHKGLQEVDECMAHFLNTFRKDQPINTSPIPAAVGNKKLYESMVQTWMVQHNKALIAPGVEVRSENVEDDMRRFELELGAFSTMWVRLQDVYAFFVPQVEVSPRTFNEEISRMLLRLPPLTAFPPPRRPPQRHITTPSFQQATPVEPKLSTAEGPLSNTVATYPPTQRPPKSSSEAAALYKNIDMAALDILPTAAFVADYHYKKRLASGSISQTTKVSVVVVGIPFRAYRQLSSSERARVNECLVWDISALMARDVDSRAKRSSKSQSSDSDNSPSLRTNPSSQQGGATLSSTDTGGPAAPSPTAAASDTPYEYFDAKLISERRRDQQDGLGTDAQQQEFASPKSPFAPVQGGRLLPNAGGHGANVVVLPIDTTITSVLYHVPSQGLEVSLLMTPTAPQVGGLGRVVEEKLHMEYLPRLMKQVLRGNSRVPAGLPPSGGPGDAVSEGGAVLTRTEEACIPLGLTLQECSSGIYHSTPKLVDVRISLQTSLNRTT